MDSGANGGADGAASQGLALLAAVSGMLDAVIEDYDGAVEAVAGACVPAFADLCAVLLIDADGEVRTATSRASAGSGVRLPARWVDIVREVAVEDEPALAVSAAGEAPEVGEVRARLGAGSLLVAPIRAGGATLGWLVVATGARRPGFGESDLRVGGELCSRLGATIERVRLYRQLQVLARERSQMAHDFNNLLTLILGYSELLSRGVSDPQHRALAEAIEDAARRAAELTQEMLDSSGPTSAALLAGRGVDQADGHPVGADPDPAVTDPQDVKGIDGDGWPPDRTVEGRILFVEDDAALRHAGQESLATVGLHVVAADSAEIAMSILAGDASYDALVTDIVLPGLSGVQLARAVRPTHPDLKVLYVTGYSGGPDPDLTPAPGEPVLRKPYRPDALRLRVAALLDQR